jgi:hypothetical protein
MKGPVDRRRTERGDAGRLNLGVELLVVRTKPFIVATVTGFRLSIDHYYQTWALKIPADATGDLYVL